MRLISKSYHIDKLWYASFYNAMVRYILLILLISIGTDLSAQRDLLYKKDSSTIRCRILKASGSKYIYAYITHDNGVAKTQIPKISVDSARYNAFDSDLVVHTLFNNMPEAEEKPKAFIFTFGIGLNIGNILEFNSSTGPDKKSFSANCGLDLGLNYFEEGRRFAMTNELHWTVGLQKTGFTGSSRFQKTTDDLATLHDFSVAMSKNKKWNFNLIAKTNTAILTMFDGDYFKDYNSNGKIQGFLNPYHVTVSPGIKFQPHPSLRLSLSPYSFSLYGLTKQEIANTGFYTQTLDSNNNYDMFVYNQLGAELNIWFDKKLKKWLDVQYRLGISSDYFSKLAKNGLLDGLFITKIKIIKNIYLAHRSVLKGDVGNKPFKPYYSQTILLSYAKTF